MIKIEVIYKDTDQAPEYFEVDCVEYNWCVRDGIFEYGSDISGKIVLIPISNILRIDVEVVEDVE